MLKKSKLVAYVATFVGGSVLWQGCLNGLGSGLFRQGFVDNPWVDAFTDFLREELFS